MTTRRQFSPRSAERKALALYRGEPKRGMRTLAIRSRQLVIGCLSSAVLVLSFSCQKVEDSSPSFDLILSGGTVYDGSGEPGIVADVGVLGDRIVAVGELADEDAREVIDVSGQAVAPGFINMLSWATTSLLEDGTGLGDLVQGVTLEVFGEGVSMGPINDPMLEEMNAEKVYNYEIDWTNLGEYLEGLERRGVATNVASFVGATTVRVNVLGYEDREPSDIELDQMRSLVRTAMEEGALGVGSSLIYPPAFFASTAELIELCKVASESGGMYISHLRSEGDRLLEAVDELIEIARQASIRAEIYHLKAAGESNWGKLDQVIARIEAARTEGLQITTDMYLYTAGSTGLTASLPPWVQEGGDDAMMERLKESAIRRRVVAEMRRAGEWENLLLSAGTAERVLLVGFRQESLHDLTGQTLAEVASARGTTPEDTVIDLILEDDSRVEAVYFLMSEDNVRRQIALPFMSFGSDAGSMAPRPPFTDRSTHPRAYGNFARLLGHYVRDEGILTVQEAVRRLTSLPAQNLRLRDRGLVKAGYFADLVVFSPAQIADTATYKQPHQLATGVRDVLVNGVVVLRDGQATGAKSGRVVRGPGWVGWDDAAAGGAEDPP